MVVFVDETTELVVLVLDGIESATVSYDGVVTDRSVSDGSARTDGRKIRPVRLSLAGTTAPLVVRAGQLIGEPRSQEIVDTLRNFQVAATPLAVEIRGKRPLESMQVERFTEATDRTTNTPITIELKEIVTATRRRVNLQPAGAAAGVPRADIADGLSETVERGTLPNKSLLAGVADSLFGLLGGG